MRKRFAFFLILFMHSVAGCSAAVPCGGERVGLQVLGSGGPEIDDQRASSGYLIWHNGKARVFIDMGGGSLLRYEQAGANLNDLEVILLTHLHVDHSADLPYLIKAAYFTGRQRDIPVYGPTGNRLMPATSTFVDNLFGKRGAFRYLSDYLDGSEAWHLIPHDVNAAQDATGTTQPFSATLTDIRISAVPVHHGPIPALSWRVDLAGRTIVVSGDMNNDYDTVTALARDADLLVAHHAIPEAAEGVARNLHMPPSVIGKIAAAARVKSLVLSHRMQRTLGLESATTRIIRQRYPGPLYFADDLQCFGLE
jgi:ribonuclease BN (tRNA processing enzyme)